MFSHHYFSTHFEKTHTWQFLVKGGSVTWTMSEYLCTYTISSKLFCTWAAISKRSMWHTSSNLLFHGWIESIAHVQLYNYMIGIGISHFSSYAFCRILIRPCAKQSWISKHDIMNMSLEIFDLYDLHGSRRTLSFTCLPSFKSPRSKYVMYITDLSTFRALGGVGHQSNIRRFSHLLAIYIFKLTLKRHWIFKEPEIITMLKTFGTLLRTWLGFKKTFRFFKTSIGTIMPAALVT